MKKFELKPLPYDYSALEPVISQKILKLHHDKHHAAYVNGTNAAIESLEKARQANSPVGDILRKLSFNLNGHLLHELFWNNLRAPKENNAPEGKAKPLIP
jgi:Fe-Mn family superoxide dismutase